MYNTVDLIIDIDSFRFLKADKGAKLTHSKTEEQLCNIIFALNNFITIAHIRT